MIITETVFTSALVALLTALLVTLLVLRVARRRHQEAPQAYLYRRQGRRVVKHDLCDDICRIGRHPDNEIQLNDRSVSRFHAQIINNRNGTFLVRDLESGNGVKVFHRRVKSSVLRDGDVVFVGNVPLRFMRYPADYKTIPDTEVVETNADQRFAKRQRHIERFNVNKAVRFYTEYLGWHIGRARDLSEEGMFIQTNQKIQLRTPIDIVMQDDHEGHWLKMTGEVARKEKDGIGVVLTDVGRDTKTKLYNIGKAESKPQPETLDSIESYLDKTSVDQASK